MGILSGLGGLGKASQVLLVVKNPPPNTGDVKRLGLNPWVGKIPSRKSWQTTQYSCLENPIDRGAWWTTVYRVKKSRS